MVWRHRRAKLWSREDHHRPGPGSIRCLCSSNRRLSLVCHHVARPEPAGCGRPHNAHRGASSHFRLARPHTLSAEQTPHPRLRLHPVPAAGALQDASCCAAAHHRGARSRPRTAAPASPRAPRLALRGIPRRAGAAARRPAGLAALRAAAGAPPVASSARADASRRLRTPRRRTTSRRPPRRCSARRRALRGLRRPPARLPPPRRAARPRLRARCLAPSWRRQRPRARCLERLWRRQLLAPLHHHPPPPPSQRMKTGSPSRPRSASGSARRRATLRRVQTARQQWARRKCRCRVIE